MNTQGPRTSVFVLAFLIGTASHLHAQADTGRLEVGAQFSTLRLADSDGKTNVGFGGRLSYDILRWLAVEGEMNLFTDDELEYRGSAPVVAEYTLTYERRRVEGFFGPKLGMRWNRFGLFGKMRPGFARLSNEGIGCAGEPCTRMLIAPVEYETEFALDLGGVVEFYPTTRTVTRLDLGSTMIRHRSFAPPCRECTSRNFASRIGVGFRF